MFKIKNKEYIEKKKELREKLYELMELEKELGNVDIEHFQKLKEIDYILDRI